MTRLIARPLHVLSLIGLALMLAACGGQPAAAPPPTEAPAAPAPTTAPAAAAPTEAPAAPAPTAAPAPEGEPLRIIATYSILGDLVQNVAGDRATVTTLVGPGGDAHTYEPTPRDSAALAEADLLFENGLEFEGWIEALYGASGSAATRVAVSEGLTPLPAAKGEHGHGEEEHGHGEEEHGHGEEEHGHGEEEHGHGEEEHGHGEYDPHTWHSVSNAIAMVEAIRDALATADAANAATYEANAAAYIAQLRELDAFVQEEVGRLPEERRKLVTTHDTFGYFADAYGFTVVGTALGITTETSDPSAGELAALVEEIRAAGVPAIFADNVSNPALMETIAREAGVRLAPPLFTDALGEPGSAGASYIDMMRYNATTIVEALADEG